MADFQKRIKDLKENLNLVELKAKIKGLEAESAQPGFWQDHQQAAQKMKQMADWQEEVVAIGQLEELLKQGKEKKLEKQLASLELKTYLSGKYDASWAILSIHAGQGGTEAMDWASMLQRMYLRFFEKKDWDYSLIEEVPGEEAGLKSTTFKVNAAYAYGYLKYEAGTHRLVRQSPFNADSLRQTSFALVEVLPQLEEKGEIKLKEEDLDWQFFRASSHGGQNVQKVSTAVRLKHKPTGIIVTSQAERYQEQNRRLALDLLKAKLWARAQAEVGKQEKKLKGGRTKAAWGTQIRSYVLHPYKMVKDLRTNWETTDPDSVLDGDLEGLIEAQIKGMV